MKITNESLSRLMILSGIIAVMTGSVAVGDLYTGWSNYRDYAMNATTAGISTKLVNFPVLLRLTSADSAVFTSATSPADLRFAKGGNLNTGYAFQVERWDAADRLAEIWVLVDTVSPAAVQSMRMYWGNATAAAASNGAAVFSPANGFLAVWHLQDLTDATGNGYTLLKNGTPVHSKGLIDSGYTFTGSSKQYLYVASLLGSPSPVTLSCWANVTGTSTTQELVSVGSVADLRGGSGTSNQAFYYSSGGSWPGFSGGTAMAGAGWMHVAWVIDPPAGDSGNYNGIYYQNGVAAGNTGSTDDNPVSYIYGTQSGIGANMSSGGINNFLTGSLNEVRIESAPRSADWISLCYQNQLPGQTILAPISMPATPTLVLPSNGATNQQLTPLLGWNTVNGATSYAVQVASVSTFGLTVFSQAGIGAASVAAAGLVGGATYYWQARAMEVSLSSPWSAVWSFTTTSASLPGVPVLAAPSNGATKLPTTLTLNWGSVNGASSYSVAISAVSTFASTALSQAGLTAPAAAAPGSPILSSTTGMRVRSMRRATGGGRQRGALPLPWRRRV